MEEKNLKIRKSDIVLTCAIVVFCAAAALLMFFLRTGGDTVRIYKNGELFAERSLSQDDIINVDGLMDVVIQNGKVRVENSVCPSGACEHSGSVYKKGESIICLPNKILIKISGEGETDAISG
ncbi:MAG: NusG domain II-containing protein [Clostridia bacterium]|nr:NusG domain II-containing protein [Clostridia bacterium]